MSNYRNKKRKTKKPSVIFKMTITSIQYMDLKKLYLDYVNCLIGEVRCRTNDEKKSTMTILFIKF